MEGIWKRGYALLHRLEGWVLGIAMLAMAVATIVNVIARNVTGDSIAATEELNQFLIVLMCFVGLSYAAGEGRHIRMTAISDALPKGARRWLLVLVSSTTSALLFVLAWYAYEYATGVDRRSPVLDVPLGWVYLIAPVGLFLGGVQYALAALKNVVSTDGWVSFQPVDGYEEIDLGDDDGPQREG